MRDAGVSGYSGKNTAKDGALGAFIKAIEDGDIALGSFLLVEDIDRLTRLPVMKALDVFQRIIGAGIAIVTLGDGQRYSAERLNNDWTALMPVLFAMARGHGESKRKSDQIGKAWRQKKVDARDSGKPIGNNAPMWIDYSEKTGYTLNPTRHELVKRIFQLYIDGYGMVAIARMLNDEKILTSRGSTWGPSSLDRVLINRAVIGEYQPGSDTGNERSKSGDPIANFYPAAIDEATYYLAQRVRESRRRTKTSKQSKTFNLYQGIGKCHSCDAPPHLITKGMASMALDAIATHLNENLFPTFNGGEWHKSTISRLAKAAQTA
jgi:DNA invertase Pin-like site-specific DNA recombinase